VIQDPEERETGVIHHLVDFHGKDVLEVSCSDGRMTWRFLDAAASVLAFDPDEAAIALAIQETPVALKDKVEFRVADMMKIQLEPATYDVGVFAWSI
jgi:ubiquinone/menaquinone biosynthesis C-methylase UbiE